MPPEPTPKSGPSRKRSLVSKRGAIACVRCKERKAKCVPAPPGTSSVPTCTNCFTGRAECVYLERTPNELFLLEYVSQLEARVAALEIELAKYTPSSAFAVDHGQNQSQAQAAAVDALIEQFPTETWPADKSPASSKTVGGTNALASPCDPSPEVKSEPQEDDEDLARGIGLLSLSGSGEPVYVGASSGVNWARVCAAVLRRQDSHAPHLSRWAYLAPPESSTIDSALLYSANHPIPALPSAPLAARYLDIAYQHIQARTGFLDWPTIRNWHDNREAICHNRPLWGVGRGADHRRNMAAFVLWLLYGFGARLTEDELLEGAVSHEIYHNTAVACLSNVASHHSLATVQAELLLTIYSFHHPHPEISVWQVGGLALRTAVQIGLHRRVRSRSEREKDPLGYEARKRAFWAVYIIDRMLALQLGRPSGIQDRDIDVELPLNVDIDFADAKEIFAMQTSQIAATTGQRQGEEYSTGYESITSMTSSIHNIRLNQLKQLIQDAIYRLDTPIPGSSPLREGSIPEIDDLLAKLAEWKACHPILPPGRTGVPLLSKDLFDLEYHNCVQMLLRPVIANTSASEHYIALCADSAAAHCEIQHMSFSPPLPAPHISNWALYRLFLSGLTLLHLATGPTTRRHIDLDRASAALAKCRESLVVFVRVLHGTGKYLDCFTELVDAWERQREHGRPAKQADHPENGQEGVDEFSAWLAQQGQGSGKLLPGNAGSGVPGFDFQTSGGSTPLRVKQYDSIPAIHHPRLTNAPAQTPTHAQPQSQRSQHPGTNGHTATTPLPLSSPGALPGKFGAYTSRPAMGMLSPSQSNIDGAQSIGTGAASIPPGTMTFGENGRLGGGIRDDFFSLLTSLGVDMSAGVGPSLPPVGEEELWVSSDWAGGQGNALDGGAAQGHEWEGGADYGAGGQPGGFLEFGAGPGEEDVQGAMGQDEEVWRYPFM